MTFLIDTAAFKVSRTYGRDCQRQLFAGQALRDLLSSSKHSARDWIISKVLQEIKTFSDAPFIISQCL